MNLNRNFIVPATMASLAASLFPAAIAQAQPATDLPTLPGTPPHDPIPPEKIAPPMPQPQQGGVIPPPHGIDPSIQKPVPDPTIDQKSVIVPPSSGSVDAKPDAR